MQKKVLFILIFLQFRSDVFVNELLHEGGFCATIIKIPIFSGQKSISGIRAHTKKKEHFAERIIMKRPNGMPTRLRSLLFGTCLFGAGILLLNLLGYVCPLLLFFGLPCPGCGMTRAVLSLLRLELAEAFVFHPLVFFLVPAAVAGAVFHLFGRDRAIRHLAALFCVALIAVYVIRLVSGTSEIVRIRWEEGLLAKLIRS